MKTITYLLSIVLGSAAFVALIGEPTEGGILDTPLLIIGIKILAAIGLPAAVELGKYAYNK